MPSLVDRLVAGELWAFVEPLLPPGLGSCLLCCSGLRAAHRDPWELLPAEELGCGSWSTAYGRFTRRPAPACSTSSTASCSTGSARPAGSTGSSRLVMQWCPRVRRIMAWGSGHVGSGSGDRHVADVEHDHPALRRPLPGQVASSEPRRPGGVRVFVAKQQITCAR
jgi:hypothetical protein